MLTGIIMASGLSTRMGENKLLMDYKGKPIFSYCIEAVSASEIDKIVVVTAYEEIKNYCKINDIDCVNNNNPEKGQGVSIRLGVNQCNPYSDYMFFVADQPLLKAYTINQIIEFYKQNKGCIIVPKYKNITANPKIFPNVLRKDFLDIGEDVRGSYITEKYPQLVKYFAMSEGLSFMDIDTKEDYKELIGNTI